MVYSGVRIALSNIVTAFDEKTIGSKVTNIPKFINALMLAIYEHDAASDRQPGQHTIVMPPEACAYVSSGVGRASLNPDDYVLRFHREKVAAYLKREFASPVDSLKCIVYTMAAYEKDPDCDAAEIARVKSGTVYGGSSVAASMIGNPALTLPTHVLVAVLANSGPPSPLTPFRLVHNLAGGNLEAQQYTADEIRAKAKESLEYHNAWSTVAD